VLRTNLSTRPFYNERSVHAVLAVAAFFVLLLTIFNIVEIVVLSRRQSELSSAATSAEDRARELRAHAIQVRQGINTKELEAISGAAREANTIIGQRLFSWTDLLNRLETTLPDEARITSMRPQIDRDGSVTIAMTIVGRRVADIEQFMKNLEGTGAFDDVFSRQDMMTEDGLTQSAIEARYLPPASRAPAGRP
jgi:Tfp pilus assembly protein PilN